MEGSPPVHVPTICPHSSLLEQAPGGKGDSNLDSPSVAQSDLVPTVTQELDRPSDPSPSNSEYCDQPRGLSHPMAMEGHLSQHIPVSDHFKFASYGPGIETYQVGNTPGVTAVDLIWLLEESNLAEARISYTVLLE